MNFPFAAERICLLTKHHSSQCFVFSLFPRKIPDFFSWWRHLKLLLAKGNIFYFQKFSTSCKVYSALTDLLQLSHSWGKLFTELILVVCGNQPMERLLLLLISTISVATGILVRYRYLEDLEVSCRPRDTCLRTEATTFLNRNCECDNRCGVFDDCCLDAPVLKIRNKRLRFQCLPLSDFEGAYVVGNCKAPWNGSDEVRRRCEDQDDLIDPLMSCPATDIHANVTYRNLYCAECNNASSLSSWDTSLTCNSLIQVDELYHNITPSLVTENITRSGNSWGVFHWNESLGGMAFYPCEVSYHLPQYLKHHIRYCRPHMISKCAATWKRKKLRCYCAEYMAAINIGGQVYRNAHCALCNRVPLSNSSCFLREPSLRTPPMSFSILLDVNQNDGDKVGEVNPCPTGERYDPFAKKCRTLVCAVPGYVHRDGRCVKQ